MQNIGEQSQSHWSGGVFVCDVTQACCHLSGISIINTITTICGVSYCQKLTTTASAERFAVRVLLREYKKIVSPVACVKHQQGQRDYHFITILQEIPTKYTNKNIFLN
jgi:shikimate kinase